MRPLLALFLMLACQLAAAQDPIGTMRDEGDGDAQGVPATPLILPR